MSEKRTGWWFSDKVTETSRWHQSHKGQLTTPDRVGDRLVRWLWESEIPMGNPDDPFVYTVSKHLLQYEEETRPLYRLARTGYVMRVIEGCYRDASAELRDQKGAAEEQRDWESVFKKERSERCKILSWQLVKLGNSLGLEIEGPGGMCGEDVDEDLKVFISEEIEWNEDDALELLTLLKNDFDLYSATVYTEEEKRLAKLAFFDVIGAAANMAVMSIPRLFVDPVETSDVENPEKHKGCKRWFGVHVEVVQLHSHPHRYSEEKVIRQMASMASLDHPLMRKLYGACHVGKVPVFFWERVWKEYHPELQLCLEAFLYLQTKGLWYHGQSDQFDPKVKIRSSCWTKKLLLDCQGLVKISDCSEADTCELLRNQSNQIDQLQKEVEAKAREEGPTSSKFPPSDLKYADKGKEKAYSKKPWEIDPRTLFEDENPHIPLFSVSGENNKTDNAVKCASAASSVKFSWSYDGKEYIHIFTSVQEDMEGGFALVRYARWHNARVAVKVLKTVKEKTLEEARGPFLREVDIWYSLNHPNIVKLFGGNSIEVDEVKSHFFVCEAATEGRRLDYGINKVSKPEESTRADKELVLWALYQAALGLQYLHSRGVVHGDLKGNNILVFTSPELTRSGSRLKVQYGVTVKLADFGLSHYAWEKPGNVTRAEVWVAPEVLISQKPTFASDIFAFGMCVLEALSRKLPREAPYEFPKRPETRTEEGDELVTNEEYKLLTQMWEKKPKDRISIFAVVNTLYKLAEQQTRLVGRKWQPDKTIVARANRRHRSYKG